jgi:type I restriction-modification system DNA methylase subunit
VGQLNIPFRQIVNDTSFQKYTESQRPDLLISEFEFNGSNEDQFIRNIIAYAEVKDNCSVDDNDWKDAIKQGTEKSRRLKLPFFIVSNCKTSYFYNANSLREITLNKNPLREFQTIDILRLIKNRLNKDMELTNIQTNVDSISTISEAIFNKKLWELKIIYRGINFKNIQDIIDFTIAFVALEFYEEKARLEGNKDANLIYWSECRKEHAERMVALLGAYIRRLSEETDFREFKALMVGIKKAIIGEGDKPPFVSKEDVKNIYSVIDSMQPLHGTGFDLFGAVYEMFASSTEKKQFGQYFTRRHYAHILAKLLLRDERFFNEGRLFTILDPACGTGGFLTEAFKVLLNNYEINKTYSPKAKQFLEKECFYGIDSSEDNISRTKLNMFLVGDGHANMEKANSLKTEEYPFKIHSFDYIITNPPYGRGTIKAATSSISTIRTEIAFVCRILELLSVGGRACIIQPDGVLENPSDYPFRKEILEHCDITAIISLPKFAFAPYTKEKTYAIFLTKRSKLPSKIQSSPIWMYIIDNDGLANSDKRFPTKLRNNRNGWLHDEISGWVNTNGEEMAGLLEERWMNYDDSDIGGTEWIDDKGILTKLRKAANMPIEAILSDNYYTLLPEFYLRPYKKKDDNIVIVYKQYQAKNISASVLFNIIGGNSGLTEEYVYSLLLYEIERKYKLLTGSTDIYNAQRIPYCRHPKNQDKNIIVHFGEGIHIVRKGKAGFVSYLPSDHYTLNDDAYLLVERPNHGYKLSLEWMVLTQKNIFAEFASNSDNGTWNKGGFLEYAAFDIPSYDEQIDVLKNGNLL